MTNANSTQAFGRYEVGPRISAGGMAEVFRAVHTPTGTLVALKRILPPVAEDEEFIKMFEDEARIASHLEHPYIARCLDFGHVDGEWFIAFEYVSGRDLRALFDRCAKTTEHPPLWFSLYVFARIGEGLAYAHARKNADGEPVSIIHRDVSPQNIVVSFEGDVKLIDFGIAKAAGKLSRTQVGSIKGKFGYMSPEQLAGREIDQRADLFSLGVCMWELLTLQRLFSADNELLVIEKVKTLRVEPPSTYNPKCPPELDRIVLKALAKDADERYRAAKDIYKDLNYVAASQGGLASREQIAQYMGRTFPESAMPQGGSGDKVHARAAREMGFMATNDKGSDLDIFEGLGKKGVPARPPSSSSSQRSATPPPPPARAPDPQKRTLLGVNGPNAALTPPPPTASPSRTPPPPPGRASLPPVMTPPPQRASMAQAAAASSKSTHTSVTSPGVEMDWDDEDEATHIFDKSDDVPARKGPSPAAGAPAAGPPPAYAAAPHAAAAPTSIPKNKATLMGLTAPRQTPPPPPPTPSVRPTPPPPPPPSAAFPRSSSSMGVGFPPPPSIGPVPLPPSTQQGLGMPMHRAPSAPPPPPPPMGSMGAGPFARSGALPGYGSRPQSRSMEATAVVRPSMARTGRFVMIGLIAAAAVVGGVLLWPQHGRVVINVNDSRGAGINRADIFVDGRKQCDTAPCRVDDLSTGSHEVKVLVEGSETPQVVSVNVESGKEATAAFTVGSKSGLKVGGTQPGVKLYVDDKDMGPLPQEVRDLAPGDHGIKLAGSERYQPLEKHVTVEKDKVEDMGSVTLKVLKGKATISLATPGARVFLASGSDRRELPMLPISVDIDTTKAWSLQASKQGFVDFSQAISFDDGQAEKSFTVTLDPRAQAPAAPAWVAPAPAPAPAPPPQREAPAPVAAAPAAAAAAAPEGAEAFLNINSIPPSTCILDGRSLGSTPKMHISVKPGAHTVKFVNADQGLTKTVSVSVGAGETKPAIARLN